MSSTFFTDTTNLGYMLYGVAYGTSLIAFVMTRINWLRAFFIISSACYALYYFIFPVEPLWLDIISEGAFVLVNIIMLAWVFWTYKRIRLSENEQHLYDSQFETMPLQDYAKLLKHARWKILEKDAVLIKRHNPVDELYYMFSGEALVSVSQDRSVLRSSGSVFGELSYNTAKPAVATVVITNRSVLVSWNQKALQKLCKSNDRIAASINTLLSTQMANKLS